MMPDDNPPVPEILQAEWSTDQVLKLFDDLRDGAGIQHVQLKSRSTNAAVALDVARHAYKTGIAVAIQIRYSFENEMWCDTIMPGDPTTRIIRNRISCG
ncbi:MAG: hypothetical protein U0795_19910 [Pirellulales bacterium]